LEQVIQKRMQNARLYDQLLAGLEDKVVIPPRNPEGKQVSHTYVIQGERREQFIEGLRGPRIDQDS
jgi:dTDP-4-amino-4,6-dideoxygalactose transaminase